MPIARTYSYEIVGLQRHPLLKMLNNQIVAFGMLLVKVCKQEVYKGGSMRRLAGFLLIIAFFCLTGVVSGEVQPSQTGETTTITSSKIDTGDTAWILVSTALVMLITPGLALFYGGMVRGKNVLGTIMKNFIALGVTTI